MISFIEHVNNINEDNMIGGNGRDLRRTKNGEIN